MLKFYNPVISRKTYFPFLLLCLIPFKQKLLLAIGNHIFRVVQIFAILNYNLTNIKDMMTFEPN